MYMGKISVSEFLKLVRPQLGLVVQQLASLQSPVMQIFFRRIMQLKNDKQISSALYKQ